MLVPSFATWKNNPPVDLVRGTIPWPAEGYLLKPQLNNCLDMQQPSGLPFTGKLVVLADGLTFSAGSDAVALLRHITGAPVVGQETGGGSRGNTSGLNAILKLPNSGLTADIHLWDYWTAVPAPRKKGRGVIPDRKAARDVSGWIKGIDSQLEEAIRAL